jgi:predicted nucleic acid-binding protein
MYLLDTNIVSELRKAKPHGAVLAWFQAVRESDLAIPAIVIGEIQEGAEITRKQDPTKATEIELWLDKVLDSFTVIPMDGFVFREWARLMTGKSEDLSADAMIAATARIHRHTIATRNVRDFTEFDVSLYNPFTFSEGNTT